MLALTQNIAHPFIHHSSLLTHPFLDLSFPLPPSLLQRHALCLLPEVCGVLAVHLDTMVYVNVLTVHQKELVQVKFLVG